MPKKELRLKQQIFLLTESEEADFNEAIKYFKHQYKSKSKFIRIGVLKLIEQWKAKSSSQQ